MKDKVDLNLLTLVLVLASVLVLTSIGFEKSAFAMGDAPSTCANRYDGLIASFIINNGSQTFDPIANPGVTFNVNTFGSYNVSFVIHTPSTSSQGNSDPGTTWYRSTAFGFADGVCLPDRTTTSIGPDQDVTVNVSYIHPGNFATQGLQPVEFSTFSALSSLITFNVNWAIPPQTTSQLTVNSQDNNGNAITGFFTTLSQNGHQIATGFTPATFTLNDSQIYTVQVGGFGKFMFDHWLDTNSANAARDVSITSNSIITAVYKTVPQPPTGLTATAISSSQISLSWTAPSNNGGSAITGYMIERSSDGGTTWSTVQSNTGSTTTYSDTGLAHSTSYTYRASAINSVGTSSPSATASAVTLNTVPTPPIGLKANAQLLQINLSWNAPSDNGGTPITGYMIERSTNNDNTWSVLVANTGSAGTTYSDTNVLPLSTYTYRVSAINNIGTGNPSNTASASTLSVGPTPLP